MIALHANAEHPTANTGSADRAIRLSTATAVLAVAGIAAYVSYWHAYAVVRAHGETGITARLEPATIDGLVYASSMVILYAARHRLPVPALARWLLTLGIAATLAANVAQGWSHGPVGAVVAAWPAASLVGSYELLVWIIRTAATGGADDVPDPVHEALQPGRQDTGHQLDAVGLAPPAVPENWIERTSSVPSDSQDGLSPLGLGAVASQEGGPGEERADHADHAADRFLPIPLLADAASIDAAAIAAYRASVQAGTPLSERKLAGMFGKTSRRWARNRIAEARRSASPA